jgi:hypothetical protein
MRKYLYVFIACLLFTTILFACPQIDKVKKFVKERILELVDGKSRNDLESEHGEEVEALLEVYDYMESIEPK